MIKKELTNSANSKSQTTDLIKDILEIKKNNLGGVGGGMNIIKIYCKKFSKNEVLQKNGEHCRSSLPKGLPAQAFQKQCLRGLIFPTMVVHSSLHLGNSILDGSS